MKQKAECTSIMATIPWTPYQTRSLKARTLEMSLAVKWTWARMSMETGMVISSSGVVLGGQQKGGVLAKAGPISITVAPKRLWIQHATRSSQARTCGINLGALSVCLT